MQYQYKITEKSLFFFFNFRPDACLSFLLKKKMKIIYYVHSCALCNTWTTYRVLGVCRRTFVSSRKNIWRISISFDRSTASCIRMIFFFKPTRPEKAFFYITNFWRARSREFQKGFRCPRGDSVHLFLAIFINVTFRTFCTLAWCIICPTSCVSQWRSRPRRPARGMRFLFTKNELLGRLTCWAIIKGTFFIHQRTIVIGSCRTRFFERGKRKIWEHL